METLSGLLALCDGNPHRWILPQRTATQRFDVFFHLRLNKRLSKEPRRRWFETHSLSLWRQCNDNVYLCGLTPNILTESQWLSWCRFCCNVWHRRLSLWQSPMPPVSNNSASWQLSGFSITICHYMSRFTVYPKKYAHGFCFAVLCCGYTLTDFAISIRLTSLALWQSNDCPSASKATLMNMDKYFMWIHYERLHNHNKAKHNKTVCIFLGIFCMHTSPFKNNRSDNDNHTFWNMVFNERLIDASSTSFYQQVPPLSTL